MKNNNENPRDRIHAHKNNINAIIERVSPLLLAQENYEELARLRDIQETVSGLVDGSDELLSIADELQTYDDKLVPVVALGFEEGEEVDPDDCHELLVKVEQLADDGISFSFSDRDTIELRPQDVLVLHHILDRLIKAQ